MKLPHKSASTYGGVHNGCTMSRQEVPVVSRQTIAEAGEFGLIQRVTARLKEGPGVLLGPGDDAAVLATPDGRVVATTDVLVTCKPAWARSSVAAEPPTPEPTTTARLDISRE